jgi:serine phosphatase RsbU (regulator of sigma subunit)/PAS domain-containing protein
MIGARRPGGTRYQAYHPGTSDVRAVPRSGGTGGPEAGPVTDGPVTGTDGAPPTGGGTVDEALAAVLGATVRRTGASLGGLYLIEDRARTLRLVALCGLPVEFTTPWQRLPLTAPVPVADAIREDRLVWVGDQDEMTRRYPRAAAVLPYRFSLAAFPVTGVRRCWGGVVLMFPADHPRETTPRERGHITSSARGLARLLDESPRPPALPGLPVLVPVALPHPPAAARRDHGAADCLARFPEGALSLDLEGRITFVDTTAAHLLGRSVDRLLGVRPWQALPWLDDPLLRGPLPHRGGEPGSPLLHRAAPPGRAPHGFTADERAVLIPLAGLMAQALDRARLHDARHRLVRELKRVLLPRNLPRLEGLDVAARWLPAGHGVDVGGDFYDLLRLDDTTAAAVIGDVEGHSIASAALIGQVRTAIHAYATARATPDMVLACTNRLLADLESDLLVSCLYAQIDLARHEVAFAGAGHVPPLLRDAPHRARVLPTDPGPLLGIDTGARYPIDTAPLPPGAVLALHTDGLVELPGTDAAHATAELTRRLAEAGDTGPDELIDDLIHCSWPAAQYRDDVTVLLLRATGPAG